MSNHILFYPHSCPVCGKLHEPFYLDYDAYEKWSSGILIQDAFPEMSKEIREILISGTCPECFKKLFEMADEEIELENSDNDPEYSAAIAEKEYQEKIDKANAAIELDRFREQCFWDEEELKQRERDLAELEKLEEEDRLAENAYYEEMAEWESAHTDQFGNSLSW